MSVTPGFLDYALELVSPLGRVTAKRMFGGYGLYVDGMMFAIVLDDALWLKTDAENRAQFAAVSEPFTYLRKGEPAQISFYRAPDEACDSPALLLPWARSALAAALRAANAKAAKQSTRAGPPAKAARTRKSSATPPAASTPPASKPAAKRTRKS